MSIVGIPDIVVLELIDVHLEATIIIEVDVGNEEEMYDKPSVALPLEIATRLYSIWDVEVLQLIVPTDLFFVVINRNHSFGSHGRQNSRSRFSEVLTAKP